MYQNKNTNFHALKANIAFGSAMNLQSLKSPLEEILIKNLLLSHDPDGRCLDSDHLLRVIEIIMLYSFTALQILDPKVDSNAWNNVTNLEVGRLEDSIPQTILAISHEILCNCSSTATLHERTMSLFDLLANYRWGDKALLALSALAKSYGEHRLVMQLHRGSTLAASVAMLRQIPRDVSALMKRPFKALSVLMNAIVDLNKCIIELEGLPLVQVKLNDEAKVVRELHVYSAVYWILRSILTCSSQIRDSSKHHEQSDSATIVTWELSSLTHRLRGLFTQLKPQVELCTQTSEAKLYEMLLNLLKEEHKGNQAVLRMLFASRDDFPLIHCPSLTKFGVSELENKVVLLLISKPDNFPIEEFLLLFEQYNKTAQESYEMIWIPIPDSDHWTGSEKKSAGITLRSLPWCSMNQPWSLNPAVQRFIKREWNYRDDPLIVVFDSNGKITNSNAMDTLFIWGPSAFPFSTSREDELWSDQKLTLQFLLDDIDPLLSKWVNEERFVCIYGSSDVEWILDLNSRAKELRNSGHELEMVYVSKRQKNKTRGIPLNDDISAKIEDGEIVSPLSSTTSQFLWIRLESMRRSKLREDQSTFQEVSGIIEMDKRGEDWAVMGRGSSERVVFVERGKLKDCIDKFSFSLVEPNKQSGEPCCNHSKLVSEGEPSKVVEVCEKCGHVMKKFVVYRPNNS